MTMPNARSKKILGHTLQKLLNQATLLPFAHLQKLHIFVKSVFPLARPECSFIMSEHIFGSLHDDITVQQVVPDQIIVDSNLSDGVQAQNNNDPQQDVKNVETLDLPAPSIENGSAIPGNAPECPDAGSHMHIDIVPLNPVPQQVRRNMPDMRLPLEYVKEFPILRFSRQYRRQEVQGLCAIFIEIVKLPDTCESKNVNPC